MTTLGQLDRWAAEGLISEAQRDALAAIVSRRRMSVHVELSALLYLGVIAFAAGLGWTAHTYSERWGDAAILVPATALVVGCLRYCFVRGAPFSRERVEPPGLVFDYVLYLGCLVFAVELGYVEYRFDLLQAQWDMYLLGASALYFALAYRFDNRFVLSLAMASLGGWFGVRVSQMDPLRAVEAVRLAALSYGGVLALAGWALHAARIKRHFLETHLHLAANVVLAALLGGVTVDEQPSPWIVPLVAAAAASAWGGIRLSRFAFVAYGAAYGYVGVSWVALWAINYGHVRVEPTLAYLVASAAGVITGLVNLAQRMRGTR